MALVLVVDDDPHFLKSLMTGLRALGHEVVGAESNMAGHRILRRQAFDIAIVDIIMPTKDGLETIIEFRRDHRDMPLIAISGGGGKLGRDFLEVAQKLGAADILRKPFTHKELSAKIEALLGNGDPQKNSARN